MAVDAVLILGCGYTGQRVAERCLARGLRVIATTRQPERLLSLALAGAAIVPVDVADHASLARLRQLVGPDTAVLHSVPLLRQDGQAHDPTPTIVAALADQVTRMVYLSTTGVYGAQAEVDEHTPAQPVTPQQQLRLAAEQAVLSGIAAPLVLRPAAIYGPGRNAYESMRAGSYRLIEDGSRLTSFIHVDDLAAHAEAALLTTVRGAYPVADEQPCTGREVATLCAELLGQPLPPSIPLAEAHETQRYSRSVDGRAIRAALGITLRYPSYRSGLLASLEPAATEPAR